MGASASTGTDYGDYNAPVHDEYDDDAEDDVDDEYRDLTSVENDELGSDESESSIHDEDGEERNDDDDNDSDAKDGGDSEQENEEEAEQDEEEKDRARDDWHENNVSAKDAINGEIRVDEKSEPDDTHENNIQHDNDDDCSDNNGHPQPFSSLPSSVTSFINEIASMSHNEVAHMLSKVHVTREDVLMHRKQKSLNPVKKQQQQQQQQEQPQGQTFDIQGENMEKAAKMILQLSPEIGTVRFRLVPAKMTEGTFWFALFEILQQQQQQQQQNHLIASHGDDNDNDDDQVNRSNGRESMNPQQQPQKQHQQQEGENSEAAASETKHTVKTTRYQNSAASLKRGGSSPFPQSMGSKSQNEEQKAGTKNDENNHLRRQIDQKSMRIVELERQIENVQQKLVYVQRKLESLSKSNQRQEQRRHKQRHDSNDAQSNLCAQCGQTPMVVGENGSLCNNNTTQQQQKQHRGKWILSKDSTDFLELDDEIKFNLRKEKNKRLEEVRDQMKFILDTDDLKDTHGEWDCCGRTRYDAQGCA